MLLLLTFILLLLSTRIFRPRLLVFLQMRSVIIFPINEYDDDDDDD